jgi:hypothetical protein
VATVAYCEFADVTARAGRFGGVFTVAGKKPDQADVEAIITDVAAEIDAAILSRGFDPAAMDAGISAAFKDVNAYGALARALPAATTGEEADKLLKQAQAFWADALAAILDGSFPAIRALVAGEGGGGATTPAGNFWDDEPDYGSYASQLEEWLELRCTNLAPTFQRGQSF